MGLPDLLAHWGIPLVFAAALAEQAGLPLPAAPILVTAGALAWDGVLRPEAVLAAALAACLIADHAWFAAGRVKGRAVLAGICRLSLSPDTCVRRTDDLIARHGAEVLMVAKFIPGVSAVAIPTAAAMGIAWRRFVFFDAIGCLAWCVAYIAAGMLFSREVNDVLAFLAAVGGWALLVLAALFALYIGLKVLQRRRLRHLYRLVRIAPAEVAEMLANEEALLILDARSRVARAGDARTFPGAIDFDVDDALDALPHDARDKTLITFCTCPNEAAAALLAERLIKAGYGRVRVLTGGEGALALLADAT
jgi:membrane protein DedA with SNARE-associated domain/rhodanese-related sulfurtransferase